MDDSPYLPQAIVLPLPFLVVIPEEPALSEVEWGIYFCRPFCLSF
jgi:hypothetical protein